MQKAIIEQKSFDFAVRIVNLYKHLLEDKNERILSNQVLRSGTSIGANVKEAIRGLKKHIDSAVNMENSDFLHGNYDAIEIPDNAFVYCDPPYANTKKYANDFDNERFWDWCRELIETKENIKLLISEYNAPEDFVCIWSKGVQDNMGNNTMSKNEKLFIHNSQVSQFDLSSLSETISISRNDIMEMVKKSVRRILKESNLDELEAWHGTVADFMKFSNSFAGTGEGSQVYGDGVYLTNVKDTGRWYAATIALKKATKGSNEYKTMIGYLKNASYKFDLFNEMTPENFEQKRQLLLNNLQSAMEKSAKPDTKAKYERLIQMIKPLNLEELKNALLAFEGCSLKKTAKNTVFGQGNPNADIMFIGEGPGEQEDLRGEPFVGPAGQLLTKMLAAISLPRDRVYICNIVKCRPPNNRVPTEEEAAACRLHLFCCRQQQAEHRRRTHHAAGKAETEPARAPGNPLPEKENRRRHRRGHAHGALLPGGSDDPENRRRPETALRRQRPLWSAAQLRRGADGI